MIVKMKKLVLNEMEKRNIRSEPNAYEKKQHTARKENACDVVWSSTPNMEKQSI